MKTFLLAVTLVLAGVVGHAAEKGKPSEVQIDNFKFEPANLTVPAGTTVVWINRDDIPHLVVSKLPGFSSPLLDTDGRFTRKFDRAGTYDYYCAMHPHMVGKVIVK